jgi:type IV secretory pathway VirB6-like protein
MLIYNMSEHSFAKPGTIAAGAIIGIAAFGAAIVLACGPSDSNPESSRGAYRGRELADDNAEQSGKTIAERMREKLAASTAEIAKAEAARDEARASKKSKKKKKKTKKKKKKIN